MKLIDFWDFIAGFKYLSLGFQNRFGGFYFWAQRTFLIVKTHESRRKKRGMGWVWQDDSSVDTSYDESSISGNRSIEKERERRVSNQYLISLLFTEMGANNVYVFVRLRR